MVKLHGWDSGEMGPYSDTAGIKAIGGAVILLNAFDFRKKFLHRNGNQEVGVLEAVLKIFRVDLFAPRLPSLRKCLCQPVELLAFFETGYVFFTNLSTLNCGFQKALVSQTTFGGFASS